MIQTGFFERVFGALVSGLEELIPTQKTNW